MTIPESGCYMNNDTSCLPCTPEEEKRVVDELTKDAESNLKEGNLYYVLSNRWYMVWLRYTGQDTGDNMFDKPFIGPLSRNGFVLETPIRPGQIDNSHLVVDGSDVDGIGLDMPKTLEEGCDYVLVPQEVWKKFHDWYKGGPALPRKLISQGVAHKTYSVEVYPLTLKLTDSRDDKKLIIRISKKESVRALYNKVCSLLDLDLGKVKIWDYFNERKQNVLSVSDENLEEACLQIDQDILLEVQSKGFHSSSFGMDSTGNELALVAIDPPSTSISIAGGPAVSNSNYYSSGFGYNFNKGNGLSLPLTTADDGNDMLSSVKKCGGGLAGLQNLGNTCFMNSALQCLIHTPPLVEYFLQDYTEEINKQNPLGLQGELAIAFGELLRKIWSSGRAPIAPRVFKGKLARFAPQFSGYNQHDSQELLAFLLDGLHEDLNRVKNKPYIEAKDANGRPDWKVANECWENHKARNDSVIVDVCQGQYKSTLVCPSCSKISVTFDPFMYLSLPLPSTVTRSMTITVLYGDGSALPMPFTVSVLKHGCVKDLMQALSDGPDGCCLKSDERLLLAEVHEHQIFRYLDNPYEQLSAIKDDDHIVAYRVPKVPEELTTLEIIFRSKQKCMSDISNGADSKPLGTPLVSCFADDLLTGADIQPLVHKMLVPLLRMTSAPSNQFQTNKSAASGDAMELDETLNGDSSSFHLWLTNERGTVRHSIDTEQVFEQGRNVRVLLEWSDRERELYDVSYIENLPEVYKTTGYIAKKNKHEAIFLFSCLEAFLKEEPLGPDDMWYCPSCKEHRQATKKLDLWRLPEILVFHLKRFSYSRYLKNKLDTFVNFPIRNLDLSKYVRSKDDPQSHFYELYAISNHYGGLGGGHYSAYAKLDKWYHFDDSHVSSVNEDEIKTSAAYVLFYRRVEDEREK